MEPERRKKLTAFLPWVLLFIILFALTLYGLINGKSSSPLETRVRKVELLATMRIVSGNQEGSRKGRAGSWGEGFWARGFLPQSIGR